MIYGVFVVRDRAAAAYGVPFLHGNRGSAIRAFSDMINRVGETDMISKHPEDFDLFELGTYDDESAKYTLRETPHQVAIGKDLKVKA